MSKKTAILIPAICLLLLAAPVLAKSTKAEDNPGKSDEEHVGSMMEQEASAKGDEHKVENQNRVETENEGEDQELKVTTKETQQEAGETEDDSDPVATKSANPRSQVAREHMSEVAKQVEILLASPDRKGGIGEQVREIAQEQHQAQATISGQLLQLDNRGGIIKTLLGPDYKAIKSMQQLIAQNQLRIQQLEQLKAQVTNTADATQLQETIDALVQQNTSLQSQVKAEQNTKSLFGWLFKLFN